MMALPGFAKDKRGKQAMKIISYNIEYGMRADTTAGKTIFSTWMRNQDPDIVCLQEANKFTQKSLEALAASYGHPYAVLQKEKGFPTAITSKYPIVNIIKVENNMWHGFVMGTINGYHIISLHLSPHRYESRQLDIDLILETIRQNGPFEKWLIMGDFNSVSPVDAGKYADGRLADRLRKEEEKQYKPGLFGYNFFLMKAVPASKEHQCPQQDQRDNPACQSGIGKIYFHVRNRFRYICLRHGYHHIH